MAEDHERFMRIALEEAERAARAGDAPVGAVVVRHGEVISRGRNRKTTGDSGLAHAELEALLEASTVLPRRSRGVTLYTTLEPCAMCLAAACFAGVETVVLGVRDPVGGAVEMLRGHPGYARWLPDVVEGVLRAECGTLLDHPMMADLRR